MVLVPALLAACAPQHQVSIPPHLVYVYPATRPGCYVLQVPQALRSLVPDTVGFSPQVIVIETPELVGIRRLLLTPAWRPKFTVDPSWSEKDDSTIFFHLDADTSRFWLDAAIRNHTLSGTLTFLVWPSDTTLPVYRLKREYQAALARTLSADSVRALTDGLQAAWHAVTIRDSVHITGTRKKCLGLAAT
jgi:hypothetical protein